MQPVEDSGFYKHTESQSETQTHQDHHLKSTAMLAVDVTDLHDKNCPFLT